MYISLSEPKEVFILEPKEVFILLPTGSDEREVLLVGSIPVAILTSCQDVKTIAL